MGTKPIDKPKLIPRREMGGGYIELNKPKPEIVRPAGADNFPRPDNFSDLLLCLIHYYHGRVEDDTAMGVKKGEKMSLARLAHLSGLSFQTIDSYFGKKALKGTKLRKDTVSIQALDAIMEGLDISPRDIISGDYGLYRRRVKTSLERFDRTIDRLMEIVIGMPAESARDKQNLVAAVGRVLNAADNMYAAMGADPRAREEQRLRERKVLPFNLQDLNDQPQEDEELATIEESH